MIDIIKAKKRHYSDFGWLKTYWMFSFSDYYEPGNIQFGALRVFNDDVVEPGMGFPTHPHKEMEIVTYMVDGEMTHKDSMGNTHSIKTGDVQRMSAGTGLNHSEFNNGSRPVHFLQIWLHPDEPRLAPTYEQKLFSPQARSEKLVALASGQNKPGAVKMHTDATIYIGTFEDEAEFTYPGGERRRVFVYVTKGAMDINNIRVDKNDQARIDAESNLRCSTEGRCEFILIDLPSCNGWGYDRKTLAGARAGSP